MKPPHKLSRNWQRLVPSKKTHSKPPQELPQNWIRLYPHKQSNHKCPMPSLIKPHTLCRRADYDLPLVVCAACKGKHVWGRMYYYYCPTCDLQFHRDCHILPLEMKHSFHPSHSLTLISSDPHLDTSKITLEWRESPSDSEVDDEDDDGGVKDDDDHEYVCDVHDDHGGDQSYSYEYYEKCKCCRRPLEDAYYHCSTCNLSFNLSCMINPLSLTILHPKSHKDPLTLFPRRLSLPCDACGLSLSDTHDLVYACLSCNYIVHESCIYLPRVIKVTHHQHRLSLTSSLYSDNFTCGVCRWAVDVSCGQYSCNRGCGYSIHSKCATRNDVWDEIDLERVSEEPKNVREPFVRIDEETIQHFTHDHCLKLQGKGIFHGEQSFCEACRLPISITDVSYCCMECNFVLHETCACLPCIKHHPLHKHPLVLSLAFPDTITAVDTSLDPIEEIMDISMDIMDTSMDIIVDLPSNYMFK